MEKNEDFIKKAENTEEENNIDEISDKEELEILDGKNKKQISELESEIASLKDTLLRKIAESENLRKRLEKEKEDAEKYANAKFAKDLLSVIDNFERVSKNSQSISEINDENLKAFLDGVLLCGKELVSVFKKNGISQIEVTEGDLFDPKYHQAICEIESEKHSAGAVIEVLQVGYEYRDRLLRPSMVSVAKK